MSVEFTFGLVKRGPPPKRANDVLSLFLIQSAHLTPQLFGLLLDIALHEYIIYLTHMSNVCYIKKYITLIMSIQNKAA